MLGFGGVTEKQMRAAFEGSEVGKVKGTGLLDHGGQVEITFKTKEQAKKAQKLLRELSKGKK